MELKPCPFCGGEAIDCEIETGNWRIGCNNARCRGDWFASKFYPSKAAAIEAWNNRLASAVAYRRADEHGDVLRVVVHGRYPDYIEAELDGNMLPFFRQQTCHNEEQGCTELSTGMPIFTCSECGEFYVIDSRVYYCPSCGAKVVS